MDKVIHRTCAQALVWALLDWMGLFNFPSAMAVMFGFVLLWAWRDRNVE